MDDYCKGVRRIGEGCNLNKTCSYPKCRTDKKNINFKIETMAESKPKKEDSGVFQGFAPRQDRILIRVDSVEMKTPGGLIIPEFDAEGKNTSMAEKPNRGTIIAIGPRANDNLAKDEKPLVLGNRVLYGVHSGFTVNHMGVEYRLIRNADAFAQIAQ